MKNLIGILFLVFAGIFLIPKESKACSCCHQTTKEMVHNSQRVSNKMANASCCNMHDTNDTYSQQGNSCGGNGTCNCSSNNVTSAITEIEPPSLLILWKEASQTFYQISSLSSGYSSFWQPPKLA